ncbi:transmembrane amino acid transporter protein domain-containing protein [Phthorimaea operculella]|nr:transmembrane amino acid transporter protein domain-containing protein [Phthorimaea operculella]
MGHVDKTKGDIVLKHVKTDNFSSTANLTANTGFQSTLSIATVANEKPYIPFEHRQVEHPNSTVGSLAHLLKSSLGSGILAMPAAFKNAGLVFGAIGTIVVGFICTHCVYVLEIILGFICTHCVYVLVCISLIEGLIDSCNDSMTPGVSMIENAGLAFGAIGTIIVGFICTHCVYVLVKTSQEVCVSAKKPSMGFAETCGAAFEFGPKRLRPWANFARTFTDYALTATYLAALCVYVVFIAENFKEVLDVYVPDYKLSVETYCALTLVPLVLICQIRNLKWLVPFSAIANVFLVICFAITMYYIFDDMPNPSERKMVASPAHWPLFISTVIFAMEGIGVVMPVENEMAKPQQFLGCPGVLNVAMTIVISLYGIVGFFGYIKYGDDVRGSVTLNLPQDDIFAQIAKILMALAILFTYSLQFYVPMEMIWRQIHDKIQVRFHNFAQISIRTAAVVGSVALAAACPNLELFISLCGAIFLSTLGLLTPAIVDTVHRWERGLGFGYWILWKNIFVAFLSIVALVAGSYTSIQGIHEKFGVSHTAVLEISNSTVAAVVNSTLV